MSFTKIPVLDLFKQVPPVIIIVGNIVSSFKKKGVFVAQRNLTKRPNICLY
jgi:hypothetical protein